MFVLLLKREVFGHFMTGRFYIATLICVLLVVPSTAALISDYERRLSSYQEAVKTHRKETLRSETYSVLRLWVDRPPNPLSILNQGLDRSLGNTLEIYHGLVPTLGDLQSHSAENPFLNLFSSIDLVLIFQTVLSLLALLFAYDSVASERQRGTLRLMMSAPVRRGVILFAKYTAALICLILPLSISLLVFVILLLDSGLIVWNIVDFLPIIGVFGTSVIYLSIFYLIGLLLSTLSHRASTALMLSIFVWVTLTFIYPNVTIFTIKQLWRTSDTRESAFHEIQQIWEGFRRDQTAFLKNDPVDGEDWRFNMSVFGRISFYDVDSRTLKYVKVLAIRWGWIEEEDEKQIPHVKNYHQFIEPLRIRAAEKTWLVRKKVMDATYVRQARVTENLLRLSPTVIYDLATEALAGTRFHNINAFIVQARQYRQAVVEYFYDENAFGAREWFAFDRQKVDWGSLPVFSFQREVFPENLKRAIPDVALLIIMNFILFLGTLLIFTKQAV